MGEQAWLLQDGDAVDRHGVPIHRGDLLKSYHFTGRRWRKRYYLYHTVVYRKVGKGEDFGLFMVPTAHLEPSKVAGGGECVLSQELADNAEVVLGYGPGDCLDYTDRPKRKKISSESVEKV